MKTRIRSTTFHLGKIKFKFNKLHIILLTLLLVFTQCSKPKFSEEISIPDELFLHALIELGVDKNKNGQINKSEAEAIKTIRLWPSSIRDLNGIEYFINLDTLSIIMNPLYEIDLSHNNSLKYLELIGCELSHLDLSGNTELLYLDCSSRLTMKNYLSELDLSANQNLEYLSCVENQLTSLDLSSNANLLSLYCGYNNISSLDVSLNTKLGTLHCNNNLLTFFDVSKNIDLTNMITCGNNFSRLDISHNTKLVKIGIDNMPGLHQVCVWTMPFPPSGIIVLMGFSPNVGFSVECGE